MRRIAVLFCLGLSLAGPPHVAPLEPASPASTDLLTLAQTNPRAVFDQARTHQAAGTPLPEAVLRQAVTTAHQPGIAQEHLDAAIAAFDVYREHPWLDEVLRPFATANAVHLLLNADVFAQRQRAWTQRAVTLAVPHAPDWTLRVFKTLAAIDAAWARSLVLLAAAAAPGVVLPQAEALVAVDPLWAEGVVREAARAFPTEAIRLARTYMAAPWGPRVLADAALAEPRWMMTILAAGAESQPVLYRALAAAPNPAAQFLLQLAQGPYSDESKIRLATFVQPLAAQTLTLEEALRVSGESRTYLHALMTMQLRDHAATPRAIESALREEISLLIEEMNQRFEQPPAVRFHAVTGLTAPELYLVIAYGEAEMFTSSYRGVFERLLASMRQAHLTGDQLLDQVHHTRFRMFMKAAAVFHRLEPFLATIPSPVERWALLAKCVSDIERGSDLLVQGMMAAELVAAPLDPSSLHLLRDTLKSEYARAVATRQPEIIALYGLLGALLLQRQEIAESTDAALTTLWAPYRAALPNLERLPLAGLFSTGVNVQRYFFYNDDDGQQSFQSFLAHYQQDAAWQLETYDTYVHLQTQRGERRIEIFANLPSAEDQAVPDIIQAWRTRQLTPHMVVHRGHTPYALRTIEHIPATAALVVLGNCGGTTLLDTVLSKAPQAHILTTKGIGSITINDPLLKALNTYLLRPDTLTWPQFWQQASTALDQNPRFVDYVPPHRNAAAVLLTAYRRLRTMQQQATLRASLRP